MDWNFHYFHPLLYSTYLSLGCLVSYCLACLSLKTPPYPIIDHVIYRRHLIKFYCFALLRNIHIFLFYNLYSEVMLWLYCIVNCEHQKSKDIRILHRNLIKIYEWEIIKRFCLRRKKRKFRWFEYSKWNNGGRIGKWDWYFMKNYLHSIWLKLERFIFIMAQIIIWSNKHLFIYLFSVKTEDTLFGLPISSQSKYQ